MFLSCHGIHQGRDSLANSQRGHRRGGKFPNLPIEPREIGKLGKLAATASHFTGKFTSESTRWPHRADRRGAGWLGDRAASRPLIAHHRQYGITGARRAISSIATCREHATLSHGGGRLAQITLRHAQHATLGTGQLQGELVRDSTSSAQPGTACPVDQTADEADSLRLPAGAFDLHLWAQVSMTILTPDRARVRSLVKVEGSAGSARPGWVVVRQNGWPFVRE